MQLPGGRRVIICTGMFEAAKALIYSSMPPNLNRYEQRKYFFKRMYGYDAPEQYLRAGKGKKMQQNNLTDELIVIKDIARKLQELI